MNEEDEAFEDLAKRQGDWGMQGSRKHQIMRYAENVENKGTSMTDREAMKLALFALDIVKIHYTQSRHVNEAIAALKERLADPMREVQRLGQEIEQELVAVYGYCPECGAKGVQRERRPNGNDKCANGHTYSSSKAAQPAQRTEQNFCPRCGKRTNDMTHIHTCTPPQDNT